MLLRLPVEAEGTVSKVICSLVCEVHSREEKYSSGPVESPRPCPPYRMVCSALGLPCSLQSVQSSSFRVVCYRTNAKLPLHVSPVPDPMAWKQDAFQCPWDNLSSHAFPPFSLLHQVFSRVLLLTGPSLIPFGSVLASERVARRSVVTSRGGTSQAPLAVASSGSDPHPEVPLRPRDPPPSHVEVIHHCAQNSGFLRAVAEVTALDLRGSTAALYQGKWFRFIRNRISLHARPLFCK